MLPSIIFLQTILLLINCCLNFAANILLYAPGYGGSHVVFHSRIADAIALAGHKVVSLEIDFHVDPSDFEGPKHAERFKVQGIRNTILATEVDPDYHDDVERAFEWKSAIVDYKLIVSWRDPLLVWCEQLLRRKDVWEQLMGRYKFDAIVYEPMTLCPTGIAHLLGIPTQIFITSLPLFVYAADLMGVPFPASHVPAVLMPDYSEQMGYFERIGNIFAVELERRVFAETAGQHVALFRTQFGADFPDLALLAREASLCFAMANDFLDFARPTQPNIVPIGGLGLARQQNVSSSLSPPFGAEMEKGHRGVVLLSMGTHASTARMPVAFVQNVLRAIGVHSDCHFLVKVDQQHVQNVTQLALQMGVHNVHFSSWLPQANILSHPRLVLFVSHAGFNSMMESAFYGVPLVAVPFFADQYRNANLAVRNGWAIRVERQTLVRAHSPLAEAIQTIFDNPKYKTNAQRTKRLIRNQPLTAEQRLKSHLDLLLVHGQGELTEWKNEARKMSVWTLHNLDIWLPALAVAQLALFLVTKSMVLLSRRIIARL